MSNPGSLKVTNNEVNTLSDPDCVRCLRKKINAEGVVVFFREGNDWRIANFQGDMPQEMAEVYFHTMLKSGTPAVVATQSRGLLLNKPAEIRAYLPELFGFFAGQSVIGAKVKIGEHEGVRLAWRANVTPFNDQDLTTLQCFAECPAGCGPG